MTANERIDDVTLHAYLDGELDAGQAAIVTVWLTANPGELARVEAWKRNDALLCAGLNPILAEPIPARIRRVASLPTYRNQLAWTKAGRATAVSLFVSLGILGGWVARDLTAGSESMAPAGTAVTARALDTHYVYAADLRHPIEVSAYERDHLNAWLSQRVKHKIEAPELTAVGYVLLGGRLLSDRGKAAALFMYEDAAGKRLTIFVCANDGSTQPNPSNVTRDQLKSVSWSDGPLDVAVTGDVGIDRLRGIGEIVSRTLKTKG